MGERRELFPIDDYLTYKSFAFSIRLKVENGLITESEELAKQVERCFFVTEIERGIGRSEIQYLSRVSCRHDSG